MKLLLTFAILISMTAAFAQTGSYVLDGVVRYGGTPVADARVTISVADLQAVDITDEIGSFRFTGLSSGVAYRFTAARFGYQTYVREQPLTLSTTSYNHVAIDLVRGFADDAEYDQGWRLGVEGDNATSGIWERAIPHGTRVNGKLAEPDQDASGDGRFCFVTGADTGDVDANESDVDGGKTTLRSPTFSLTEITDPVLHFSYWFSNDLGANRGGDFFRAQISSDGGITWKYVINSSAPTNGWNKISVKISDFVATTDHMLLQFVAEDDGPGSLVEAAVDDIAIIGAPSVPEPPRDLLLDVQFNNVVLTWKGSADATGYRVYMSNFANDIVKPENLFTTTTDTTLTIPVSEIPYNEFYFQVTAIR
jgi:hypothetical protein